MPFSRHALARRSFALLVLALSGCAAGNSVPGDGTQLQGTPPLSSLDAIYEGLPGNTEVPLLEGAGAADQVLPSHFDTLNYQSPVRDQGSRGVCATFATVALMENLYKKAGLIAHPDFSEQYLNWVIRSRYNRSLATSASSAASDVFAIHLFGIPVESAWPYEKNAWNSTNDASCGTGNDADGLPWICYSHGQAPQSARDARQYGIANGTALNMATINIKTHLATNQTGVIVGLPFYQQAWNSPGALPVNSDLYNRGIVLYPNANERTIGPTGGHEVLLVGWDDTLAVATVDAFGDPVLDGDGRPVMERGFFLFKNSWGTDTWGSRNSRKAGYGWISYQYVQQYGVGMVVPTPSTILGPDTPSTPAGPSTDTITTTVESAGPLRIPDNSPTGVTSLITLPVTGAIQRVDVRVHITHSFLSDVVVTLSHPDGTSVTLLNAQDGAADFQRTYTAVGFVGKPANGVWSLHVVDVAADDTGTLQDWNLTVTNAR